MEIVVIGNGILATSTALRLANRSHGRDRITVIGRNSRPGSATLAAAAMLNSFCEVEKDSLDSRLARYRFDLSRQATRMWPGFITEVLECCPENFAAGCSPTCKGLCESCFPLGTYLVNNTAADRLDEENFCAVKDTLELYGEPYSEVDPCVIPNYMPEERFRALKAIYLPNEGWLNPRFVLDALDSALTSCGNVDYVNGEVENLIVTNGAVDSVVLEDGEKITGDSFLLATGATATDLLLKSGLDLGIQKVFYGIGVSLQIESPSNPHLKCVRTPNRGLACGLYTVPHFTGHGAPNESIVIGASNFISPHPAKTARMGSVANLMKGAMEQINKNFFRATVAKINVGWRPTSSDTYPLLGSTSLKNLFIATGTKRDGFHLCPVLSQKLCSLIHGEKLEPEFEVFNPERPLIKSLSRELAIEKSVKHQISAAYQHGYNPSHGRLDDRVRLAIREDLERLHDKVGATDWGIPPELTEMYRYGHISC